MVRSFSQSVILPRKKMITEGRVTLPPMKGSSEADLHKPRKLKSVRSLSGLQRAFNSLHCSFYRNTALGVSKIKLAPLKDERDDAVYFADHKALLKAQKESKRQESACEQVLLDNERVFHQHQNVFLCTHIEFIFSHI